MEMDKLSGVNQWECQWNTLKGSEWHRMIPLQIVDRMLECVTRDKEKTTSVLELRVKQIYVDGKEKFSEGKKKTDEERVRN